MKVLPSDTKCNILGPNKLMYDIINIALVCKYLLQSLMRIYKNKILAIVVRFHLLLE